MREGARITPPLELATSSSNKLSTTWILKTNLISPQNRLHVEKWHPPNPLKAKTTCIRHTGLKLSRLNHSQNAQNVHNTFCIILLQRVLTHPTTVFLSPVSQQRRLNARLLMPFNLGAGILYPWSRWTGHGTSCGWRTCWETKPITLTRIYCKLNTLTIFERLKRCPPPL